jgi:hypothetical protein
MPTNTKANGYPAAIRELFQEEVKLRDQLIMLETKYRTLSRSRAIVLRRLSTWLTDGEIAAVVGCHRSAVGNYVRRWDSNTDDELRPTEIP